LQDNLRLPFDDYLNNFEIFGFGMQMRKKLFVLCCRCGSKIYDDGDDDLKGLQCGETFTVKKGWGIVIYMLGV
jgi:hypothetical protein